MTHYGIFNESTVHAFGSKSQRDAWVSEQEDKRREASSREPLVRRAIDTDKQNRPTEYGGLFWHKED